MHRAERREAHLAARDLRHGNVVGAVIHQQNAETLHRLGGHQGKGKGRGGGKGPLARTERREHRAAVHDLRHGNLVGAAIHEHNAEVIHHLRPRHHGPLHAPVAVVAVPIPVMAPQPVVGPAVVLRPVQQPILPVAQPYLPPQQQPYFPPQQQPAQSYPLQQQPASAVAALQPIHKQGMATKEGGWVRNWKRRSFCLNASTLRYYDPSRLAQPKGTIPLTLITDVREAGPHMHVVTRDRTYKIAAEDCPNSSWVVAIQHNLCILRGG